MTYNALSVHAWLAEQVTLTASTSPDGAQWATHMRAHWRDPRTLYRVAVLCTILAPIAARHRRLEERFCNEAMSRGQREYMQLLQAAAEAMAGAICAAMPRTDDGEQPVLSLGDDPRAETIRVKIPNHPHDGNTWGRDGEYTRGGAWLFE